VGQLECRYIIFLKLPGNLPKDCTNVWNRLPKNFQLTSLLKELIAAESVCGSHTAVLFCLMLHIAASVCNVSISCVFIL